MLTTVSDIARKLGLSRAHLVRNLKQKGAPAPVGRRYGLAEVTAHVSRTIGSAGTADELKRARIEEVRLRCEALRRGLALSAREVVSVEFVHSLVKQIEGAFSQALYLGVESSLPPSLDGQPAVEIRRKLREWADRLIDEMTALHATLPPPPRTDETQT
jgi:hypothetical protein